MKAVVFKQHGGPEVLEYADAPDPLIKANEVLVEVKACALNHLDVWTRGGLPGIKIPLPHILGNDIARRGARSGLAGFVGASGRRSDAPARRLLRPLRRVPGRPRQPLPRVRHDRLSPRWRLRATGRRTGSQRHSETGESELGRSGRAAAGDPDRLAHAGNARPGSAREDVLVHAAGSGVGSIGIQVAKLRGARVIATASSDEKLAKAKELGADEVVNYSNADWPKK